MLSSEGYEKFKEEHRDRKVYDVKSLLNVGQTMQFYEEQSASDMALNIGKSIYNGAVSQTVGDALHGLQALRDYNEAILNEELPDRMQMSEEARSILDTAANAEFLQPYEVRANSGAERLAYDLAQGAGQLGGQVVVGALTGGYGNIPAMALQITGNEYKQLREQGVDVKRAAEAGMFNALVQTPLEYIGFSKIKKAFPANTLFKQRLRMFAEDAVTEGITEFLQEYPEQASIIWAMQHKGEPLKDTDTMVQEILQTAADNFDKITPDALYSGTIGAVLGGGAGGIHMALDRNITRTMEREAHNIRMEEEERRIEKIKESKVNPPYAAAVINDNMQGETVYVDGEALNAYAQAHDVQKVADSLGVTVDDIQSAAENGDTVDVKLGNFEATGAAFDGFFQAVRDDTAFEDGGYTVNKDKLEQERDKAEEEQRDALRVEQDRLLDEIKKAGANSTTAANAVALITSRAINTDDPVKMMKSLSFRYGGDGAINQNGLQQFAGKNAKGANLDALNKAYAMDWANKTPEEIFAATGWFKGKDGQWRYEIADNLDKINYSALGKRGKASLQKIYDNPALYEAYPFLKRINIVAAEYEDNTEGMAYGRTIEISKKELAEKPEEAKRTLIHEIQHLIQRREGFAVGGSAEGAREMLGGLLKRDKRLAEMSDDELYYNLAGEQEARYSEDRATLRTQLENAIEAREDAEERYAANRNDEQAKHDLGVAKLKEAFFRRKLEGVPAPHDSDVIVTFGDNAVAKVGMPEAQQEISRLTEKAQRQMDEVRAQYEGTDAWMKAPNGADTRLTEEQWLTVRTPAFKAWFGDWENDAENASKVVDENGEPLVVYHGSKKKFDAFSKEKIGSGTSKRTGKGNHFGSGFYFTPNYFDAQTNGKNVYECFLVIKKPAYGDASLDKSNDGIFAFGFNGKEYVVFEPTQIKSATGNNGQFLSDDPNIYNQAAWHGSPHRFTKFDLGAIGTGEGAQVHGWGLYFAQDRNVAKGYRDALQRGSVEYDGKRIVDTGANGAWADEDGNEYDRNTPEATLFTAIKYANGDIEKVKTDFQEMFNNTKYDSSKRRAHNLYASVLRLLDEKPPKWDAGAGSLFQVEIPDNDVMLDEQKTFEEQPEKVQEALKKLFNELVPENLGENAIQANYTGKEIYRVLNKLFQDPRTTSETLNEYGIEGITYEGDMDGRCFVVFDDAAINIIDTYNKQINEGGTLVNKGEYNPNTNIITLFKGADASTVIHETWHFFVEQMWNSLQDGTASKQTQKDFDALLKYAGMTREEWANADTEGRRAAHEKLAEAGETYIMEGRAPSYDLRRVFKNFAKWLKNVYRVISRSENAAELTDEVREVFDRMLAAEDDIARMERVNGYFAKLPDVITNNMSDETRMKVEDFIEKARDKAVNILTRRALQNYTKKRREEIKKFKDEIRPSVEDEINKRPVYACGYNKNDVERYKKLREQQAGVGVWSAESFIDRAFTDETEKEIARYSYIANPKDWADGLSIVRADYVKLAEDILKPALDVLESGMGQGVDIIKYDDSGRGYRLSKNAQWDRDFYKAHKRKPNKQELREMARLLISGDVNAPKVEGWIPTTEEEAQAMKEEGERLADIERHIEVADSIKGKLLETEKNYNATGQGDTFLLEAELTAEQYGYSSADEMMKDVESALPKSEAVKQRINERVQELSPESEQEYYKNSVRESLYNEDEALLIGVEQQLIEAYAEEAKKRQGAKEQKAAEKKVSAEIAAAKRQQAKNAAKDDLAKMSVKDAMRTSKFITAERRAAIKAAQLLLKKDYEGALTQKNLQAYWHAMAAESIKVAQRKAQYDKFLKTQRKAKPEAWLNETHFAAVSSLFVRMGIARPIHRQAVEQSELRSLAEYAELMGQQFDCVDIPDWILDSNADISDMNSLTLEEYEDVINAIKNIKAIVKAQKGENAFKQGEAWAETKTKIMNLLAPLKTLWKPNPNKPTKASKTEEWLASAETLDTFCEMLDGGEYGWFTKFWNNAIKQCSDREYDYRGKFDKAEADAIKKWLPDKAAEAAAGEEVYYKELDASVTKHTLVKMLINLGNKDNAQRLCETVPVGFEGSPLWIMPDDMMGVSREEAAEATKENLIDFLGRVLTKEDVEYAQRKINAAEMFWGEKNALEKRTKGFSLKKVEATPVVLTINGEQVVLQGGYFPLMRYGETGSHSVAQEVSEDEPLQGRRIRTYHTNTSATKARTKAKYPVDLRIGMERHWLYESIHDVCWRETMSDFRRVLNDQELFGLLKSKIGGARMNLFKELLEVSADPTNSKPLTQAEKLYGNALSWISSRTSHALIMCNLKVVSQNFADALLYGNAVKGYTMADNLSALGRYMLRYFNPATQGEMEDFVFSKSVFMKERSELPDITVREIVSENKEYAWEKFAREIGVRAMAYTDNATAIPNWIEAYNKQINNGATEQEAIDFADAIVRRVKGSSRITEVSSMQRSGPLMRPLVMFQSFFNARLNEFLRMERYAMQQWTDGEKAEAFGTVASYVVGKWFTQALLATALALENPFGIDDEDKWPTLIKELKSQTFSMAGPFGQIGSWAVGLMAGMNEFDYRMSAVESTINKAGRVIKKIKSDKATKAEKVEGVTDIAGIVGGIPAQFNRIFWNLFDAAFNNMSLELGDIMRRRPKKERKNKKKKE